MPHGRSLDISQLDSSMYYEEYYMDALARTRSKQAVIVVTSWSSGAMEFPRSVNIGSRQARHLPHNLVYAQKLRQKDVRLKIYYLAFDNTQHFNQKDKRCVDNYVSKAYRDYILSFEGTPFDDDQFEGIYLNPHYREKDGDLVEEGLPVISNNKGETLHFTGENAIVLRGLKQKLDAHRTQGHFIIGMTAHSGGSDLEMFCRYFSVNIIGTSNASLKYGTKEGNKKLFAYADVPYIKGSIRAHKSLPPLIHDCCDIAERTKCNILIIKHNASSAGKGNLDVDISKCYEGIARIPNRKLIDEAVRDALFKHLHPEKDKDLLPGEENFYIRKIIELGAIVEEKFEGKKVVSPASFAVVKQDVGCAPEVIVEDIYDQVLLGDKGQNFGGSMRPSELSDKEISYMSKLTHKVGLKFAELGGRGYIGVDFLKIDDRPIVIIEANIRTTGTKYPYILLRHLLGDTPLTSRATFHDDNIKLPFAVADLTGRRHELNLFIDAFFRWIRPQDVSFNMTTKMGAIITFESHTNGKIGVLSVGRDKEHVKDIRKHFVELFEYFATTIYPREIVTSHPAGVDLAHLPVDASKAVYLKPDGMKGLGQRGLVIGPVLPLQRQSFMDRIIDSFDIRVSRAADRMDRVVRRVASVTTPRRSRSQMSRPLDLPASLRMPSSPQDDLMNHYSRLAAEGRAHPFIPHYELLQQRGSVRRLVFVIFGRTRTSDKILLEAAAQGIICYRMTENSEFTFDENTRTGSVKKVSFPKVNPRTGKLKMYADETTSFDLPTVVYDYDFSGSRKLAYHTRGDRLFLDKNMTVKKFLNKIGAVFFNGDSALDSSIARLSPTRSQWAFYHVLQTLNPELFSVYPFTLPLLEDAENQQKILSLISSYDRFFIKPVLSERRQEDIYLGNIFLRKAHDADGHYLTLEYCINQIVDERKTLIRKSYKISLANLRMIDLMSVINEIKSEMDFAPDVQFLIQVALRTPVIRDHSSRAISGKIRVITQHDPVSGEVIATSIYGVYGGHNAYLGYVGDPQILIKSYLGMAHDCCLSIESAIYSKIFEVAVKVHKMIEVNVHGRMGELITDILLTTGGVVPLKVSSKPERPDIEMIKAQTHFGHYLEGSPEARTDFISVMEKNEAKRTDVMIREIRRLHQEAYYPAELMKKSRSDRFFSIVPGAPLPPGIPIPTFRSTCCDASPPNLTPLSLIP